MKNFKLFWLSIVILALSLCFSNLNLYAQELEELQEEKFEPKKEEPKKEQQEVKKEKVQENDLKPLEETKEVKEVAPQVEVAGIPSDIKVNMEDIRPLFKEKYEYMLDAGFETVYKSILKAIDERGCMVAQKNQPTQDDQGLQKASIKSDDCVFSIGEDSTFKVLRKYSLLDDKTIEKDGKKVTIGRGIPNVRGGKWLNGRLKYNFKLQEQQDGKTLMTLKTEISGYEDYVTHEVLFWSSNGILEAYMLNTLFKHLRIEKGQ